MLDRMFVQNNIIGTAMQGSLLKNDVILNNIANVDTPDFKKSTVNFQQSLADVIDKKERTGVLNLSAAVPRVEVVNSSFSYRLDGNNVDIDAEMVSFYENAVKYDVMSNAVMNNYRRINSVISSR